MSDDQAEQTFFQDQAMNAESEDQDVVTEEVEANADDQEYDPMSTLDAEQQTAESDIQQDEATTETPTFNPYDASHLATGLPNDTADASQDLSQDKSQMSTPAPPVSVSAQPQTRTIGGFEVDDEDEDGQEELEEQEEPEEQEKDKEEEEEEEEEEADYEPHYEPPAALGVDDTDAMTMAEDPNSGNAIQNTFPDVSSQEPMQGSASMPEVANSSYSPAHVPNIDLSASAQAQWASREASLQNSTVPTPVPDSPSTTKGRLPYDRVGILQDRVDEDPRGDITAWLELIAEHRNRNRLDSAREVYEAFLKTFPMAADQWVEYATMESELNELFRLEQIFNRILITMRSVNLWSVYLDYVRRRNPLSTDANGECRRIISSAYDLAVQYVGMDKDSGNIWSDYIEFIRTGPGNVGGSGWQDQQKMDLLRKAYQRAICVPTQSLNTLWKEYDQFEMGLSRLTGRKLLQEQSPVYMTARGAYTEVQNITRGLIRTTLPRLPPVPGFEGDVEFAHQVDLWKRWIAWEKSDPLLLKEDDDAAFKGRVTYVYKQALMALRFMPEIWFEAADFCFLNNMVNDGNDFLKQGIEANPESCLLAFKQGDRIEITSDSESDSAKRAAKVREPYDKLIDALYDLSSKVRDQESQDISRIEETFAKENPNHKPAQNDDDEDFQGEAKEKVAAQKAQIDAVKKSYATQLTDLYKTASFAWIALMRAMRRIQGKGKPGEVVGSRQIFAEARKRGRITSDVYIASALMEYHCYKDPSATKIFERGAKLFPGDENFALEYLKHLIDINDIINARAVFETTVRRLASNPENVHKAKPIFAFLHEYESRYGDLVQVINLENRMRELYPEDPSLDQFSHRYITPTFDPISVRLIFSPSQTQPKTLNPGVISQIQTSPAPGQGQLDMSFNSPKRPYPGEDFDYDSDRPRKFVRAESPLKAAQGRRLDQQKRGQPINGQVTSHYKPQGSPAPLPREVVHLLSIIPHASAYNIARLSPEKMIDLIRRTDIPASTSQIPLPANARGLGAAQGGMNAYGGAYR